MAAWERASVRLSTLAIVRHATTLLRATWICGALVVALLVLIARPVPPWVIASMAIGLLPVGWWEVSQRHAGRHRTVLLVGSDPELAVIAAHLSTRRSTNPATSGQRDEPIVMQVPTLDEATRLISRLRCHEVVLGDSETFTGAALTDRMGEHPRVSTAREMLAHLFGRVRTDLVMADPWYSSPTSNDSIGYRLLKRTLDVVVASVCLVVLALPSLAIAAFLALLGMRGPLAMERRVGKGQREFTLFRFRTRGEEADTTTAAIFALRAGILLRRTHLDQIPALWNVIRGDLSLVGPRPESVEDMGRLEALVPIARARVCVRPGLASLAQVRFRYSDNLRDTLLALEYDLYYARYHSPARDLRIFARASWLLFVDVFDTGVAGIRVVAHMSAAAVRQLRAGLPYRQAALASVAMPRSDGRNDASHRATLVVGAGSGGRQLVQELRRDRLAGLWPVAFVDDDHAKIGTRVSGLPVLGDTEMLRPIVRREHIETIVIAIPSAPELVIKRIADEARQTDAQVLTMPDIGTILRGGTTLPLQAVPMTDVLGRPLVAPDMERCRAFLAGRRILITGAAGSIGSELARQVAQSCPAAVFGLDINESDLYDLVNEVSSISGAAPFQPIVASITDHGRVARILRDIRPEIVFHAAAYKHVPLMEDYPAEAVETNTVGSYYLARAAATAGVQRFVLVSTDKAVRPSSVMGASKRLAELSVRAVAHQTGMSSCAVRFGNVLGSRGSVIPLFEKQIALGGPVTVTHPEMMRYFMTIPEAVGLIIEAGALGDDNAIYILDMGEEISIRALAERLIRLKGLRVGTDIAITYTGIRPGEKLRESLSLEFESAFPTQHAKIRKFAEGGRAAERFGGFEATMARLLCAARAGSPADIRATVLASVAMIDGDAPERPAGDLESALPDPTPLAPDNSTSAYGAADD